MHRLVEKLVLGLRARAGWKKLILLLIPEVPQTLLLLLKIAGEKYASKMAMVIYLEFYQPAMVSLGRDIQP